MLEKRRALRISAVVIALALGGCTKQDENLSNEHAYAEFAGSLRIYYTDMAKCMTEQGVPMRVMETGDGIEPAGRDTDQIANAAQSAFETCDGVVGGHPPMPPPPTRGELSEYYELQLGVVDCLRENGFDTTEPPSSEVYVETYLASLGGGGSPPWDPYTGLGQDGVMEALETCPQPPLEQVFEN